ncbi:amino acid ABC transporter permease [Malikia granosa]|uniref:Amino acid ABC transporter permease n=1 Tax=Malikia granosa TaxID=263067 RepID=A0A2S9K1E3_9BURK|nr:amino acid ABC transporter permease [Malikia granosa]
MLWQALALAGLLAALLWLVHNTQLNMAARGIQSGWDFLGQTAGFDIGEQLIAFDAGDSLARAFLVGLLNTLRVALLGILLCTLLGTLVGLGQLARNGLLRGLCRAYVELFRNVPLLVQLLVWYLLLVEYLPDADAAWSWREALFLSKAGLAFPALVADGTGSWSAWHWELPALQAFGIEGGAALSPEFIAVTLGLGCYTAAFVAEVVRAGIKSVPSGQIEAAQSIGLSRRQTLRLVTAPLALRVILPPLTNQYLNLTKNSSLAVAIGYPDLVSIANTTLNQTGRAVECIAVIMLVYLALSLLTAALMAILNRRVALKER